MATLITSPWSTGRRFSVKVEGISAEQAKLTASDGDAYDYFGCSVSLSSDGNVAVIGAYGVEDRGSAYVFTRTGSSWTQQAKLTASDRAANDYFGWSVTVSGDGSTAVIGARGDDDISGSAYIFVREGSSWTQQAKLTASDGESNDRFGCSVAVSSDGNTAVIGAHLDNDDDREYDHDSGSAYVFTRSESSWTQRAKLKASDGANGDNFGCSVAVSGDGSTVVIGANRDDSDRGSVYVFTRAGSSWTQQAKLTASDGAVYDQFGNSIAISGDGNSVVIGAYADSDRGNFSGSVYVFVRSGSSWTQQAKVRASDGAFADFFGYSVAVSSDGSTAVIGANQDGDRGSNSGSAYVFI